jgi:hypothetical protein
MLVNREVWKGSNRHVRFLLHDGFYKTKKSFFLWTETKKNWFIERHIFSFSSFNIFSCLSVDKIFFLPKHDHFSFKWQVQGQSIFDLKACFAKQNREKYYRVTHVNFNRFSTVELRAKNTILSLSSLLLFFLLFSYSNDLANQLNLLFKISDIIHLLIQNYKISFV